MTALISCSCGAFCLHQKVSPVITPFLTQFIVVKQVTSLNQSTISISVFVHVSYTLYRESEKTKILS